MRLKRPSTEAGMRNDDRPSGDEAVADFDQGRDAMNPTPLIRQRLEEARSLAEILSACYDAFDEMLSAFDHYENGRGPFYAALIMAGPAAADGRNTIGVAPSFPPPDRDGPRRPEPANAPGAQEVADSVAVIATLVAGKLRVAAAAATFAADRSACVQAALYADEVRGFMTGEGP